MAQTPTTIAKKLYVTVQYRGDTNNTDGLLGFASPYTKDAAFERRKSTQDSWAYGGARVAIDEEDQVTVTGSGQRAYGGGQAWDASMLFIAGCYPRIIDNEPVEGFEIAKSVRRYGWNGGGNVKWRITDPRGFDLEISSENFASVLSCSTMVNGVIQGKCVWGRQGSNNILLPESSEPFITATAMTTKVNTKISLKDVNPGDKVEILSTKVLDKNKVCYYMGKYFFLQADEKREDTSSNGRYGYGTGEHRFDQKQTEKYLFKSANGGDYFTLASPKIVAILDKIPTPVNKLEVAKTVTAELSRTVDIDDVDNVILLSPTKIDLAKITTTRVPLNETFEEGSMWPKVGYYSDHIYCEYDGKTYMARNGSGSYNNATRQYDYSPLLTEITDRLAENRLDEKYTMTSGSGGYWGRGPQRENITRSDFKFADLKMFRIVVTDGTTGITGKVYRGI